MQFLNNTNFYKMHALGNHFILIDYSNKPNNYKISKDIITKWHNIPITLNFDQLLLILNKQNLDFFIRIYNQDGSESGQCLNGMRCIAHFIWDKYFTNQNNTKINIKTISTTVTLEGYNKDNKNFGKVDLNTNNVTLNKLKSISINNQNIELWKVDVGNPHCICLINNLNFKPNTKILTTIHNQISEYKKEFPNGVNTSLVSFNLENLYTNIITYERGTGITQCCGSANASTRLVLSKKYPNIPESINFNNLGGILTIIYNKYTNILSLISPICYLFKAKTY